MPNIVSPVPRGGGNRARIGFAKEPDTTSRHRAPVTRDDGTRATCCEPLATQRPRATALIAWRPLVKGALRGFATVELPIGLKLVDCPVFVSSGKAWVSLPSKPVLDRDGRQKIDVNEKPACVPLLESRSRGLRERFSEAVLAAIRQVYPGAIGEGPQ
jgi:hypothetical protein